MTYEERKKLLDALNEKKRILELQTNLLDPAKFADDFLKLADEYGAIEARANQAWCMNRYRNYSGQLLVAGEGVKMLESVLAGEPFVPEPEAPEQQEFEYEWQKYTGD